MTDDIRSASARLFAPTLLVLAISLTAGRATALSYYLGDELKAVAAQDRTAVANPQPVQLVVEFPGGDPHSKGAAILRGKVLDAVSASGVFASVSDAPVANGAVLTISIRSTATEQEKRDAGEKGYVSGATLGLVPGQVTDNYVCTVDFVAGASGPKITETSKQALTVESGWVQHAPPHTVPMPTYHDAIFEMIRDLVSNALNDLAKDPAFQGATAPPKAP